MRMLPILICTLLLCACSSGKPQYIPPPVIVEPEPVVQIEAIEPELTVEIEMPEPIDEKSFLAILIKEGTPAENIIPRSKEQVAVYSKGAQVRFYYFRGNVLILQKDYPAKDVERMKTTGNYPDSILREMNIIE